MATTFNSIVRIPSVTVVEVDTPGLMGPPGKDGKDGANGKDGMSIVGPPGPPGPPGDITLSDPNAQTTLNMDIEAIIASMNVDNNFDAGSY